MNPENITAPVDFLKWPLPAELENCLAVTTRNKAAPALAQKTAKDIIESYVYLSEKQMEDLVSMAERFGLGKSFTGSGIELGAGCGLLSVIVAKRPQVEKVYALEVVENMAKFVIPKVAQSILHDDSKKVIPVVGSFDDLKLEDNSLDFAIEIDSFHHSDNLPITLAETFRVLKPGGILVCFDRSHPNTLSDEEVDKMLSVVYTEEFLVYHNYPRGITLTRRQNGEHEYRLREWEAGFHAAGFKIKNRTELSLPMSWKPALKGILGFLPEPVRRKLYKKDGPTLATTAQWLSQMARKAAGLQGRYADLSPKKSTLFVVEKPLKRPI